MIIPMGITTVSLINCITGGRCLELVEHISMQRIQLMQDFFLTFMPTSLIAFMGQLLKHMPQPIHSFAGLGNRGSFVGFLSP